MLEDKQPTLDVRKREVDLFKSSFNLADFVRFIEGNGFLAELRGLATGDDRFFYFAKVLEGYYSRPNVDFGFFILNSFQRRHPDIHLGMCPQLSIDIGDIGYLKTCSPPGLDPVRTYCTGFRYENCRDFKK